ncbi:NAD(P)-binding protein [Streptomyces sp. A7024]|uniref:NAD(P)-binding protein n=1 Tax=Streptomyces coryli TaxID=1128680 RepID=A0A6G4U0M3_9ACTN|nr:FAD-dependent monooxygenase [Streptomyces coryli]NGN64928.1 NAD(P)-binding protein [Streptomyces coryli]
MGTNKAIIVGAGIGGLAAAQALRRIGWEVALFEQAPVIGPVGAGLAIAPNAVKALEHLGLGAGLRDRGLRQEALEIRLRSGRRVARIPAAGIERRYGAPFYALHRAEAHRLLMTGLDPSALHTGYRATGVETISDKAMATPTATVTFDTPHGPVSDTADLVVAADGVGSGLRTALLPSYPGPDYAGYTVWRGIVPAERAAPLRVSPILTETWGPAARFGVAAINDGQIYWFACESLPEHANPAHDLSQLADRFRDWHAPIPDLLAATEPDAVLRHDVYYLHAKLPSFVHGRVALLGDAAHAVTPDIGQGACLAIEDAVTLAAALERSPAAAALTAYDTSRRPRTQRMARASGRLGHLLQTASRPASALRDTVASLIPTPLLTRATGAAFAWDPPWG